MRRFNDGQREWSLEIDMPDILRVNQAMGITLFDLTECDATGETLIERLTSDLLLQVDVIWHLLGPQAAVHQLTKDQFEELLQGQVLRDAINALFWELEDFFLTKQMFDHADLIPGCRANFKERLRISISSDDTTDDDVADA